MELPPGPNYLLRLLPYFAFPSAVAFASLELLQRNFLLLLPSWIIILLSVLSRPILVLVQRKYSRWQDRKAAAALGAVLAPVMEESPLEIISEFVAAFDGYPGAVCKLIIAALAGLTRKSLEGDLMHRWSRKYGNSVQFSLLTNATVGFQCSILGYVF